jgi:4-amino-4-deoxy-L-arabinose transferase-like glycosyltransferase
MKRSGWLFLLVACLGAVVIVYDVVQAPDYTDAFYYFNSAEQIASGNGLTDEYLFTYIGAPDDLPAPAHLYWMPMTSLVSGVSMGLLNAPGDFDAAQVPLLLMLIGIAWSGYWLGWRLGGTLRHAWVAGVTTLAGGFFVTYWGVTDTFTPYAFFGGLALIALGIASTRDVSPVVGLLAGLLCAAGHLTRADGLLLVMVAVLVLGLIQWRLDVTLWVVSGYLIGMSPWFLRNLDAVGTLLPVGGTQAIWFDSYNDLFNYPPAATPSALFADGISAFLEPRWVAFYNNLLTFIAVEGVVIIGPLALLALWNRRRDRFLWPLAWYALGLHAAMTFVFPHAGYRGGLFHSASALFPFWMALGVVGLDDLVDWISARRRNWRPKQAKRVFSVGLVVLVVGFSIYLGRSGRGSERVPELFQQVQATLPPDARVMVNDPAQLFYYTGLGGVVVPNAPAERVPEIAAQYGLTHLLLETGGGQYLVAEDFDYQLGDPIPPYLERLDVDLNGAVLYAINP